uniref:WD_REPEATS_REGION domain-containing protein n=1 Tax=Parastrongyloides trichosuri TaxID=131310 RepID=A0A0N5A1E4_PARTI
MDDEYQNLGNDFSMFVDDDYIYRDFLLTLNNGEQGELSQDEEDDPEFDPFQEQNFMDIYDGNDNESAGISRWETKQSTENLGTSNIITNFVTVSPPRNANEDPCSNALRQALKNTSQSPRGTSEIKKYSRKTECINPDDYKFYDFSTSTSLLTGNGLMTQEEKEQFVTQTEMLTQLLFQSIVCYYFDGIDNWYIISCIEMLQGLYTEKISSPPNSLLRRVRNIDSCISSYETIFKLRMDEFNHQLTLPNKVHHSSFKPVNIYSAISLATSDAVMYPKLLPTQKFYKVDSQSNVFTHSEIILMKFAFARFNNIRTHKNNKKNPVYPQIIDTYFPGRTSEQLRWKISSVRTSKKKEINSIYFALQNKISYYEDLTKKYSEYNGLIRASFDVGQVLCPLHWLDKWMPEWMQALKARIILGEYKQTFPNLKIPINTLAEISQTPKVVTENPSLTPTIITAQPVHIIQSVNQIPVQILVPQAFLVAPIVDIPQQTKNVNESQLPCVDGDSDLSLTCHEDLMDLKSQETIEIKTGIQYITQQIKEQSSKKIHLVPENIPTCNNVRRKLVFDEPPKNVIENKETNEIVMNNLQNDSQGGDSILRQYLLFNSPSKSTTTNAPVSFEDMDLSHDNNKSDNYNSEISLTTKRPRYDTVSSDDSFSIFNDSNIPSSPIERKQNSVNDSESKKIVDPEEIRKYIADMQNIKEQKKRNRCKNTYGARHATSEDYVKETVKVYQSSTFQQNQIQRDPKLKNFSRRDIHRIRLHLGMKKQEAVQSGTWDVSKDVFDPDEVNEACVKLHEDKKRKETENAEKRKRHNLSKKVSNDDNDKKENKSTNVVKDDPYKDLSKLQRKVKRQHDGKMAMKNPFYQNKAMKKISTIIGEDIQQKFSLHKGMLLELEELLNKYGNDQKTFIEKLQHSWGSHFEFMTQLVSILLDDNSLVPEVRNNPTRVAQENALEIIRMIYIYCYHSRGKLSARNVFKTIEKEFQEEGNEIEIGQRLLDIFKKETPLYNYLKKFVVMNMEPGGMSDEEEEYIDATNTENMFPNCEYHDNHIQC